MQANEPDHQMLELGESQEGKYEEAGGGTGAAWNINPRAGASR